MIWIPTEKSYGNNEPCFKLSEIKTYSTVEMLLPRRLWVAYILQEGCLDFAFFEFGSIILDDPIDESQLNLLLHGRGFTGGRECRHTYWGEEGYIFYPNASNIIAAINWLTKYFDMD